MKKMRGFPLIIIIAAAIAGLGILGFFAIRKYDEHQVERTLKRISSKCPLEQPEGITWEYIPSGNIAGLTAVGRYSSESYDMDILAFENGKAEDNIGYVIMNCDAFYDGLPNYRFTIDEKVASKQKDYSYFMFKNDAGNNCNISQIRFYKSGETVTIDYTGDMSITYRINGWQTTIKSQIFDSANNMWNGADVIETVNDALKPPLD